MGGTQDAGRMPERINRGVKPISVDGKVQEINTTTFIGKNIITFDVSNDFRFCLGEIGTSDFSPFIDTLPRIDICYAALPKPENFPMWYQLARKDKIDHPSFLHGLFDIFKNIDAREYHVEVGPSNRQQVETFFTRWGVHEKVKYRPHLYSAPLNGRTEGMAKCRVATGILVIGNDDLEPPSQEDVTYSHQYVQWLHHQMDTRDEPQAIFDPVIGKGLIFHGATGTDFSCFGIEMNPERLDCAMEYAIRVMNSFRKENG
ncbi:MAG: hypothetical protein ACTSUE_08570 [Promethearchaeota archaeon]